MSLTFAFDGPAFRDWCLHTSVVPRSQLALANLEGNHYTTIWLDLSEACQLAEALDKAIDAMSLRDVSSEKTDCGCRSCACSEASS